MKEIIKQTFGQTIEEGHLGGCSVGGDAATYHPIMWEYIKERYNIKTVLDVGCGIGYAAKFFKSIGCSVKGVEGSRKVQELTIIPEEFYLHDYEEGSALKENEFYDLCWSCEFVEHVWEQFSQNFIDDFKKCKYLAMTFAGPGQGGHHHVNCQPAEYWIQLLSSNGFEFLPDETEILKQKAIEDKKIHLPQDNLDSHFVVRGLFFRNVMIS